MTSWMEKEDFSLESMEKVDTHIGSVVLSYQEISLDGSRETIFHGTVKPVSQYGTTNGKGEIIGILLSPWKQEESVQENCVTPKLTYYGALKTRETVASQYGLTQKEDSGKLTYSYVVYYGEKCCLFLPLASIPGSLEDGLRAHGQLKV